MLLEDMREQCTLLGWPGPWWVTVDIDKPQKPLKLTIDVNLLETRRRILRWNEDNGVQYKYYT